VGGGGGGGGGASKVSPLFVLPLRAPLRTDSVFAGATNYIA
jgi:hypothetical protein